MRSSGYRVASATVVTLTRSGLLAGSDSISALPICASPYLTDSATQATLQALPILSAELHRRRAIEGLCYPINSAERFISHLPSCILPGIVHSIYIRYQVVKEVIIYNMTYIDQSAQASDPSVYSVREVFVSNRSKRAQHA